MTPTFTQDEIDILKRGLSGLQDEIHKWLPGKKTWLFGKRRNDHAEHGTTLLSKLDILLLKLDALLPSDELEEVVSIEQEDTNVCISEDQDEE